MRRFFDGDRTITLHDGRALGYSMLGDPRGQPVIFVGGYPGSRLMARLFDGALERGIRLVGIDRPGAGLSDFKPGWEILDFPGDLVELADQLSLDRFAVLGWSGGGPYALACAYQVPERLSAVGLVASIGMPEAEVQGAMKRNQVWRIYILYQWEGRSFSSPKLLLAKLLIEAVGNSRYINFLSFS